MKDLESFPPRHIEALYESLQVRREKLKNAPPVLKEHWRLTDGYEGILDANAVIVNVRDDSERPAAEAPLGEIARLRRDRAMFSDITGDRGNRLAITAVVANVSDPEDEGLKKAVAKVKRAVKRMTPKLE